ncbi:MAG: YwiC-like family protein [Geothrix sp.]|nr:YwiC-like family protein [Geothrix sp.]
MPKLLPPLRSLLPAEHGSWFMLGFPMALGLLLRPSLAGACLGLAALCLFLGRPALRRLLSQRRDPAQLRALLLLGGAAGVLGALALLRSGPRFLIPLACVSPLALLALRADVERATRSLAVELAAQAAFAGLAAALVLAGGGPLPQAGRAWLFATLLGGANLAHVRRFLGSAHRLEAPELRQRMALVHGLHLSLSGLSVSLLATGGLPGLLWTGWTLLLYARALRPYRPLPARTLGWREGGLSAVGLVLLWRALA